MISEFNESKDTRILLYMDILGARKIIDTDPNNSQVIQELIEVFSKNNKEYQEEDFPTQPRKCYLIRSSFLPQKNNLNLFTIPDWTAAYIRFDNKLFYALKGASQCDEIAIDSENILKFDDYFKINKIETNNPKLLIEADLEFITNITSHTHSVGLTSLKRISPTISSYSDHISISVPYENNHFNLIANIGNLISHASWLHHLALDKGFLMRGGLTIGSLKHIGNVIIGKALNKAVTIEENVAVYPRVVVEKVIGDFLMQDKRTAPFVDMDQDGLYFINYLQDTRYVKIETIPQILNTIDNNIRIHCQSNLMGIYAKWSWLKSKSQNALYHILNQLKVKEME